MIKFAVVPCAAFCKGGDVYPSDQVANQFNQKGRMDLALKK